MSEQKVKQGRRKKKRKKLVKNLKKKAKSEGDRNYLKAPPPLACPSNFVIIQAPTLTFCLNASA